MRNYGVIPTDFWSHPRYTHLSVTSKLIAVYLLSCHHANILGCFRLPEEYIAVDLSLDKKTIRSGLQELMKVGFVSIDFKHHWIFVHSFLEWSPIENPNQAKHAVKFFEKIPSDLTVYPTLIKSLRTYS